MCLQDNRNYYAHAQLICLYSHPKSKDILSSCKFGIRWVHSFQLLVQLKLIHPMSEVQAQEENEGEEAPAVNQEEFTEQDHEAYNKMMETLSRMNSKIEKAKVRLGVDTLPDKHAKTGEIADKLIQSKQSSQIITKQNLLEDITTSYQKVVIEVYSENSKLKKRIEEMAKLIKEQSNKIYDHTKKERDLLQQNETLRSQIAHLKDQQLLQARGRPLQSNQDKNKPIETTTKKTANVNQNQDFDFWSMPQNDHGKKKKEFVEDSGLWANQKQLNDNVFMTEHPPGKKKK